MTTRRNLFKSMAVAAAGGGLVARPASAQIAEPPFLWMWDEVQIIRLEEDGSFTSFSAFVAGGVQRPENDARRRRVDMELGPDHWDLLWGELLGPRDEAYYEQRFPVIGTRYVDRAAYEAGRSQLEIKTYDTAHFTDAGAGLHRWAWPGEVWSGVEWKWNISAVSPDWHFEMRRQYEPLGKDWMWV